MQINVWASLVAQMVKSLPAALENWVRSLDQQAPLDKDIVLPVAKYAHPKCEFGNQENDHCETNRVRMLFIN